MELLDWLQIGVITVALILLVMSLYWFLCYLIEEG
jgi:hypothetical protein